MPVQHVEQLIYPKKHPIIRLHQQRLQKWFGDKRRINHLTDHTNRRGQRFIFGRYGHGKDSVTVTVAYFINAQFIQLDLPKLT